MASHKHFSIVLILWLALMLAYPCASAWSNGGYSANLEDPDYGTHDWIAEAALTIQTLDVTFLTSTYHSEFLLGTEAPDNPDYIGDTTKHHVYYYSSGQVQDDICAQRASQIYQTALDYLLGDDFHSAAYDIGVLAHYVADVGVFGHTMGTYTDWGAESHHSDYENEIETLLDSLSLPAGTPLGDMTAYSATLALAEDVTFGSGAVKSNVWMDTNYDWADSEFVASARASLFASVSAVAAVINHLMIEAGQEEPPSPPPPVVHVPQAPTSLTTLVDDSHVVLTWVAPSDDGGSDITHYEIYRGPNQDEPSHIASVAGGFAAWIDESTQEGQTYFYRVAARNSAGMGSMSAAVSATIPEEAPSLALPIAVVAVSISALAGGLLFLSRRRAH